MRGNMRVKPSKEASMFGFLVGIVFVGIGLFVVIPQMGGFGILWTLIAVGITAMNGINAFGNKGIASFEIDASTDQGVTNFDEKLRKLKALHDDGILTDEEYTRKKNEILNEKL